MIRFQINCIFSNILYFNTNETYFFIAKHLQGSDRPWKTWKTWKNGKF